MNFSSPLMKVALALGAVYVAYKYGPNNAVKGAALGVGGLIVAKQIPVIKDVV